jgi:hypothetical protein
VTIWPPFVPRTISAGSDTATNLVRCARAWDVLGVNGQYLDSSDPRIRRASAAVYAIATGVAVATWLLLGGWSAVEDSDRGSAAAWLLVA